jgi:hypothetical protein
MTTQPDAPAATWYSTPVTAFYGPLPPEHEAAGGDTLELTPVLVPPEQLPLFRALVELALAANPQWPLTGQVGAVLRMVHRPVTHYRVVLAWDEHCDTMQLLVQPVPDPHAAPPAPEQGPPPLALPGDPEFADSLRGLRRP